MSRRTRLYRRCKSKDQSSTVQNIMQKHSRRTPISNDKAMRIAGRLHADRVYR